MYMIQPTVHADLVIFLRVVLSCFLGGLIGWEREKHRATLTAGIRTYGAIALGSCMFGILSFLVAPHDPSRIAAQVVTGIGFLGGGIIFRQGNAVTGLTTAATLWATAAVGLSIAYGLYFVGIFIAILIYLLLYVSRLPWWKKVSAK